MPDEPHTNDVRYALAYDKARAEGRTRSTAFQVTMWTQSDDQTDPDDLLGDMDKALNAAFAYLDIMPEDRPTFFTRGAPPARKPGHGERVNYLFAVKFPNHTSSIDDMIVCGTPGWVAGQVDLNTVHSVWTGRPAAVAQARELLRELADRLNEEADKKEG